MAATRLVRLTPLCAKGGDRAPGRRAIWKPTPTIFGLTYIKSSLASLLSLRLRFRLHSVLKRLLPNISNFNSLAASPAWKTEFALTFNCQSLWLTGKRKLVRHRSFSKHKLLQSCRGAQQIECKHEVGVLGEEKLSLLCLTPVYFILFYL